MFGAASGADGSLPEVSDMINSQEYGRARFLAKEGSILKHCPLKHGFPGFPWLWLRKPETEQRWNKIRSEIYLTFDLWVVQVIIKAVCNHLFPRPNEFGQIRCSFAPVKTGYESSD